MRSETPEDITALVRAWSHGDRGALERLIPLVDGELRRIARRYLEGRRREVSLQTTSLLNEAYVRLVGVKEATCRDRVHFFALCASIIRGHPGQPRPGARRRQARRGFAVDLVEGDRRCAPGTRRRPCGRR